MAKASKRHREKQKQRQLKIKRNWSIKRTTKLRKKPNKRATSIDKILPTGQEASNFLHFRAESEQESGIRVSSTSAKSLAHCLMNSLSNTASKPVHFLCTCMLLCSSTIHRSFDVVNRGKDNVHTAVSCSMARGYSKIKKVSSVNFFKGIIWNSAIDILFDLVVGIGANPASLPLIWAFAYRYWSNYIRSETLHTGTCLSSCSGGLGYSKSCRFNYCNGLS